MPGLVKNPQKGGNNFFWLALTAALAGLLLLLYFLQFIFQADFLVSPLGSAGKSFSQAKEEKPLEKYTVLNLANYQAVPSEINQEKVLEDNLNFTSYLVSFKSEGRKVTGLLNLPKGNGPFPVIVMLRGFVDPTIYETGMGTKRVAQVLAQNGFITLAPDFLGYGGSDNPSQDVFEERFQTYTVALDALASVATLEKADKNKIGLWGHSNGGQIALTILEASQKEYPTVLWAPVSKPFPYSILYYTDEASDRGKSLRKKLAEFEAVYEADLFAITDYFNRIKAPIQLHQGSSDEAVPQKWSDQLNQSLKEVGVTVDYYIYQGADHNLMPQWSTAVARTVSFYQRHFEGD